MTAYVPVYKKIMHTNGVLVERALPGEGLLKVKTGDMLEAFTEIGTCKYSHSLFDIDPALSARLFPGKTFSQGEAIGKVKNKDILAPFSGVLEEKGDAFRLVSEKKAFTLLSGVWGEVVDVTDKLSVLIKSQMMDIHLMASTNNSIEGELVVFPNPSSDMQMQYLKKYHKNVYKKILYVGDTFQEDLLEKACELNVSGIFAGSANRALFTLAKKAGLFLGVFSGFGDSPTPRDVFSTLTNVSNRYVFAHGSKGLLRVPMPGSFDASQIKSSGTKSNLKLLKKGVRVILFSEDRFGWVGGVEKVNKGSIVVKLEKNDASIEVELPNVLALI